MKGIIAEIDKSKMIVITKNGEFIKCKKLPNCDIGDEVNIPKTSMVSMYKKMSAVAASFLIFAMLSSGVYAYYTPYSYVSVDINPSLELSMNRFERVIGVHAFNEDAKKVLKASADIKNKDIDDALEQILKTASDQGYLKSDAANSVMLVVSSGSETEKEHVSSKVSKASTETLSDISSNYEVILEKTAIDDYKEAKKKNISPGKVILANKFKEVKPELDEEEIRNMPLQQAIKQIEKKEHKEVKEDKKATPGKPAAAAIAKDDVKLQEKNKDKIKNVKELIMEKNEELGNKLKEQSSNKNKDKENKNQKEKDAIGNGNRPKGADDKDKNDYDAIDHDDDNDGTDDSNGGNTKPKDNKNKDKK